MSLSLIGYVIQTKNRANLSYHCRRSQDKLGGCVKCRIHLRTDLPTVSEGVWRVKHTRPFSNTLRSVLPETSSGSQLPPVQYSPEEEMNTTLRYIRIVTRPKDSHGFYEYYMDTRSKRFFILAPLRLCGGRGILARLGNILSGWKELSGESR